MLDHSSEARGLDDRATARALFSAGRLDHRTKRLQLAPTLVCLLGWLLACGDNTSTSSGDAGGGKDSTGGRDTTTGGDSAGQDTGSTADASGSDGAGDDGTTDAGVMETAPSPSLCDGKPKKPLPYAVLADFTQVALIGPEVTNFTQIVPADCNATTFPPIPPPNGPPEAGTSDAGTDSAAASDAAANSDAIAAPDATADTGTASDASVEGGDETSAPPPPPCYEFLYNPSNVAGTCVTGPTAGICWAGAIFQSPGSTVNTGAGTGICVDLGATKVTFSARASRDGARIKFGSTRPGLGATEFFLNVTTTWQTYMVSIPPGEPYNEYSTTGGVWNGFSVVVEPQDHIGDGSPGDVGTYILVKDVVWSL